MKLTDRECKVLVEQLPSPVWVSDKSGFKTYFNEAWYNLTGRGEIENLGEGWINMIHKDDVDKVSSAYMESVKGKKEFMLEYRIERPDGELRWVREHGIPLKDEMGEYLGFLGSCIDLTERQGTFRILPKVDSDVLTGLLSRDRFRSLLSQEIKRSSRYQSFLSIVYIDIDNFGEVNETHGFEQGDKVLKMIGDMVLYNIRGIDLACRDNGDVFIVALPETSVYDAEIVAERIRETIETSTVIIDEKLVRLRASLGISQFSEGTSMDNFIENAQKAKEHARTIGGNRVQKLSLF